MPMKAKNILALLLMLIGLPINAQVDTVRTDTLPDEVVKIARYAANSSKEFDLPSLLTPSPKATMTERFGIYPTDLYHGLVDVSIPITTIQEGSVSIPIVLRYHGSGLKYDDLPLEVGYGWTLSAGGMVTYQARGAGLWAQSASEKDRFIKKVSEIERFRGEMRDVYDQKQVEYAYNGMEANMNMGSDFFCDSEYDVFNFTLPNGQFFQHYALRGTSDTFTVPKTTYSCDGSLYPSVRDDEGNEYRFDICEATSTNVTRTNYLTEVICQQTGQSIRYKYHSLSPGASNDTGRWINSWRATRTILEYGVGLPAVDYQSEGAIGLHSYDVPMIDEITYRGGKVKFVYSTVRTHSIKEIEIYNASGVLSKRVKLLKENNEYLTGVDFCDATGKKYQGYSFEYYGRRCAGMFGTDYWGYCNAPTRTVGLPDFNIGMGGTWQMSRESSAPNLDYTRRGSLRKVVYPTGGSTEFEYELNRTGDDDYYGGLRIAKLSNYDTKGNLLETHRFEYGFGRAIHSVNKNDYIVATENVVFSSSVGGTLKTKVHIDTFYPYPICSYFSQGSTVVYPSVTEYVGKVGESEGRTEYQYSYFYNDYNYTMRGYATEFPLYSNEWKSGKLIGKKVYDSNGKLVYGLDNDYKEVNREDHLNLHVNKFHLTKYDTSVCNHPAYYQYFGGSLYDYYNYYLTSADYVVTRSREFKDGVTRTTNYSDFNVLGQARSTSTANSDGTVYLTTYKYLIDKYNSGNDKVIDRMYQDNIVGPYLERREYCDKTLLHDIKRVFTVNGGNNAVVLKEVWDNTWSPGDPLLSYGYDSRGNIQYACHKKIHGVSYLWGYNGRLPIVELKGSSFSMESILGADLCNRLMTSPLVSTEDMEKIEAMRKEKNLEHYLVTTMYYDSNGNVAKTISPNGVTTTYTYDGMGRLKFAKDGKGKLLSSYDYTGKSAGDTNNSVTARTAISEMEWGTLTTSNSLVETTYFDDLGRKQQVVQQGITPSGKDLVTYQEYDFQGRESKSWLPLVASCGTMPVDRSNLSSLSQSTYGIDNAYKRLVYEPSPLDKVLETYSPPMESGESAVSTRTETFANTASGELSCLQYMQGGIVSLSGNGTYSPGTLSVTKVTDPEGKVTLTFKDLLDRTVLERRSDGVNWLDTYYLYDSRGNLSVVLPPAASAEMTTIGMSWASSDDVLDKYAYLYIYDSHDVMTAKKLPGTGWYYYYRDSADRIIFSQSPNQVEKNSTEYDFTLYDNMDRIVLKGKCDKNASIGAQSGGIANCVYTDGTNNGILGTGYSVNVWILNPRLSLVNYYDNYSFLSRDLFKGLILPQTRANASGLLTGTVTVVNDEAGTRLLSANCYDERGLLSESVSTNYLGGSDRVSMTYNHLQKPLTSLLRHTASDGKEHTERLEYTYGKGARLDQVVCRLDGGEGMTIAKYVYDELGRVKSKHSNRRSIGEYEYNVHSLPTSVFASYGIMEELSYTPSGNIKSMNWMDDKHVLHKYNFTYDGIYRLLGAEYYERGTRKENYDTSYSYDLMGNITRLCRNGKLDDGSYGTVDDLVLGYDGNQLKNVENKGEGASYYGAFSFVDGSHAEREYFYDANGNMTKDLNKGISKIEYDDNNLPCKVSFADGSWVDYVYTKAGTKLRTVYHIAPTTLAMPQTVDTEPAGNSARNSYMTTIKDYCGSYLYEDGKLKTLLFDGGYASLDSVQPRFHFYVQDHLGNNRAVVGEDGKVEQRTHYYPFGGVITDLSTDQSLQPYKYNGKELDRMHGLDWYDYGARNYDGLRFTTPDRYMEKYLQLSPYAYCANNPLNAIDENGDSICVLLAPGGAKGLGHIAVLIQNSDGKWALWSKNGTEEHHGAYGKEGGKDSKKHNNRGDDGKAPKYASIDDFFNGEQNPVEEGAPEYTEGFLIPTDGLQDQAATNAIKGELAKDYNVLTSNCAQAVQAALKAAGLNPGHGLRPLKTVYPSITKNNKGCFLLFYNYSQKKYYKYK